MKKTSVLRLLALILALLMLLLSAACTKDTESNASDATDTDATEGPEQTEKPTDKEEDKEDGGSYAELIDLLAAGERKVTLQNPAIPADCYEETDLSKYSVQYTLSVEKPADEIVWSSDDIEITDGRVTANKPGVYALTATAGEYSRTVYLVSKYAEDTEYVLYENSFDDPDAISELSATADSSEGTSFEVRDGQLVLSAIGNENDSIRVLLPEWLADFGNYTLSVNATITEAANTSRWLALMYRIQNDSSPYYQMCVREGTTASNGLELAYLTAEGEWEYHAKSAGASKLTPDTLKNLELSVSGSNAKMYEDGIIRGSSYSLTDLQNGKLGLQASGCVAVFDDLRITLNLDRSTNVTLPPAVISEVASDAELDALGLSSPDIALMTLGAGGEIITSEGESICSPAYALTVIPSDVIPAFSLPSSTDYDLDEIRKILTSLDTSSVIVISDDAELIKELRTDAKQLIGAVDFRDWHWSGAKLIDARSEANRAGARICLLPNDYAQQETVEFFNTLGMSVWFKTKDNSSTEAFRLITSGANGIIAEDRETVYRCLSCELFLPNSIIRPINIIGHRGMPSRAPENTLAGGELAAKYGANVIEIDIYVTTDDVLVIMHDSSLERTTNGDGNIEDMSYEQLCKYLVDDKPDASNSFTDSVTTPQPIPTLEEFIKCFEDTDTYLFIEIKSSQRARIAPLLKELIDKYDFYDQCSVICFSKDTLKEIKKVIPELSVGYLCDTDDFSGILASTAECESSYNPGYAKLSPSLLHELAIRGILSWPWTVNESVDFDRFFLMGVGGITTNYSDYAKNYVKYVRTERIKYKLSVGESVDIGIEAEYYSADRNALNFENAILPTNKAEMLVLEGNSTLKFDGRSISASEAGEASVIFRLAFTLNNGTTAYVYTQPVRITVE